MAGSGPAVYVESRLGDGTRRCCRVLSVQDQDSGNASRSSCGPGAATSSAETSIADSLRSAVYYGRSWGSVIVLGLNQSDEPGSKVGCSSDELIIRERGKGMRMMKLALSISTCGMQKSGEWLLSA